MYMYIQKSELTNNITTNIDDSMHVGYENLSQYKKSLYTVIPNC